MRKTAIKSLILLSLAAFGMGGPAAADEPIRIIVPFAAGGPVDAMARLLANEMQKSLDATVIVEDRGGAGGVIGTDMVSRAAPDGKTLLMASLGSHVISAIVQPNVKYDPVKSFDAIAMVGYSSTLLVTTPNSPVNSFKELVALAKSKPLTYGSAGVGTTMNIAGELLNASTHVKVTQVPYRGVAPALPDLMGGRLDLLPADPPVLLPLVAAKKVKPLVVYGHERLTALPDIPTTVELGYPDMIMENWYGLLAPAGLPADMKAKLEKAVLAAIKAPAVQEHMKKGELRGTADGKDFKARIEKETAFWRAELPRLGIPVAGDNKPAK